MELNVTQVSKLLKIISYLNYLHIFTVFYVFPISYIFFTSPKELFLLCVDFVYELALSFKAGVNMFFKRFNIVEDSFI